MAGSRAPDGAESRLPNPDRPLTATAVLSELDSATTIQRCVNSLIRQEYPPGHYSVIVVDGGSTDGTQRFLDGVKDSKLTVRRIPGLSESAGQQIAAGEIESDFILFTNSDVYVPPDWVRRHAEWHRRGYDMVGGAVFQSGDSVNFSRNVRTTGVPRTAPTQGAGFGFANFSVGARTYRDCGGIRDLPSQQDAEFVLRALAGRASAIIDPAIEVEHDHPLGTLRRSFLRSYGYRANHSILEGNQPVERTPPDTSGVGPWELWIPRIVRELSGVEPWAAYRAFAPRVPPRMRRPGFVEFLWLRFWGFTVPELLAYGRQTLSHRPPSAIRNVHQLRAT